MAKAQSLVKDTMWEEALYPKQKSFDDERLLRVARKAANDFFDAIGWPKDEA